MNYLLDVNCLVALFDSSHVNHEAAHTWFGRKALRSWATCSITENGCVRVLSSPAYPTVLATLNEVVSRLKALCSADGRNFWPDEVSILNHFEEDVRTRLSGHQQPTEESALEILR